MARVPNSSHPALSHTDAIAAAWQDVLLLIGRVALGYIFAQSGLRKLMDMDPFISVGPNSLVGRGVPWASFWGWIGAPLEFIGGIAIIVGLGTRYASLAILLFTIVATLVAHRYWEFPMPARQLQLTMFFKNLSMAGGLILLFVTAAGRISVDNWLKKK
jgi:putative oxidoreductase